jgi:hypothetical protein
MVLKIRKGPCMVVHTCHPNIGRLRQEDHKFEASLGYIVPVSKTTNKQKPRMEFLSLRHNSPIKMYNSMVSFFFFLRQKACKLQGREGGKGTGRKESKPLIQFDEIRETWGTLWVYF